MLRITDDYDIFNSCKDNGKNDIDISIKSVLLSFPANKITKSLMVLVKNTMIKPLITNKLC